MRLYFHIPFCRQRCTYCKFALTPVVRDHEVRRYLAHMLHEAETWLDSGHDVDRVDSVYFGGGTPSVLSLAQVDSLLSLIRSRARVAPDVEICFESNPEDISADYIRGLASLGVTRLSLGVQTLSEESLRIIGRSGRDHVLRAYDAYTAAGAGMILSTDFIAGLPMTRVDTVATDIRETLSRVDARHSSVYMLESGRYPPEYDFPEESIPEAYFLASDELARHGFARYEVSNFAKPGAECRHNQGYWRHEEYRGFGLSAASYVGGERRENSASFSRYYRGEYRSETIGPEELRIERIMFGLRTRGIDEADIGDRAALERFLADGTLFRRD